MRISDFIFRKTGHCPAPLSHRRGVSILEVLFAILVTTIGLLGAIAVFPVASAMARKGRLNDAMAVAGISAVHQFDVQYMRNPSTWLYYDTGSSAFAEVGTPTAGQAYFIDPGFMTGISSKLLGVNFPYYDTSASTNIDATSDRRMTRVSLKAFPLTTSTTAMPGLQAESIFVIGDDLAYDRPTDRSLNALQLMVKDSSSTPLKRQTEGLMMWAATIAPKVTYTSGTVDDTDLYILSILVFNRRDISFPLDTSTTDDRNEPAVNPERLVDVINFPGSGVGGGEVLLQARSSRGVGDLDLRANDWVMLSGYKEATAGNPPVTSKVGPLFLWYRVSDTDPEIVNSNQRYVTLQGPDWPIANTSGTSYTQATIVSGVVAVYEKTIRLDTGS